MGSGHIFSSAVKDLAAGGYPTNWWSFRCVPYDGTEPPPENLLQITNSSTAEAVRASEDHLNHVSRGHATGLQADGAPQLNSPVAIIDSPSEASPGDMASTNGDTPAGGESEDGANVDKIDSDE